MTGAHTVRKGPAARLLAAWRAIPVRNVWLALLFLHLAVLICGLESAYVQLRTTWREISPALFTSTSFILLLSMDLLVPLALALLSRPFFILVLVFQTVLSTILLHYTIFFYNPLTLSSIYHSMQGAASLGVDIFAFARWDIICVMTAVGALKILLVQLSRTPDTRMPAFWAYRGVTAIACIGVVTWISVIIYGKTGMSLVWIDSRGHRPALERRMEEGTGEAVHTIGYIATWIGEFLSGTYKDVDLIYRESSCENPALLCTQAEGPAASYPAETAQAHNARRWDNLPLPPIGETIVFIQVESLDFAALSMKVNGHTVLPFIDMLAQNSLVLKVFAPHKVGSSNSDYELLNSRTATQNVIYYSYIKEYPDSIFRRIADKGYRTSLFHGLGGHLFNLREAYSAQGIHDMYFKEELLEQGYAASDLIMNHIHDQDVFACAAEYLERGGMEDNTGNASIADPNAPHGQRESSPIRSNARQAQFIITMSSHVPFVPPLAIFKSAGGSFARYVSALRQLDQTLASYYARLPEGTVLILWGDHGSDVAYPAGFPQNTRHVPFIIHVKGNTGWAECSDSPAPAGEASVLLPYGKIDSPRLASQRIYTLCELGYLLRAIFE